MAGAHARLTGGLGVAIASNGPGVANALERTSLAAPLKRAFGYGEDGAVAQLKVETGVRI